MSEVPLAPGSDPVPLAVVVTTGVLGWRNNRDAATEAQLELYGSGGRWARTIAHGETVVGDSLVDAVIAAGATEGADVLVIAGNRFAEPLTPEQLLRLIRTAAPGLLTPLEDQETPA